MAAPAALAEVEGEIRIEASTSCGVIEQKVAIEIHDATGMPVEGVRIVAEKSTSSALTDRNGIGFAILQRSFCGNEADLPHVKRPLEGSVTLITKDGKEHSIDLAKELGDEQPPTSGRWIPFLLVKLDADGVPEITGDRRPYMVQKASAFLETLTPDLREKATTAFDSKERENWHFVPKAREGVALKDLNEPQKKAALELLNSPLSDQGSTKVETIMALEAVLAGIENNPRIRDAGLYTVMIFGTPGDQKGWGWRFEGHHISINMTMVDGKTAVTPTFLGANPAEVKDGPLKGTRALQAEEDRARMLAGLLLESGKPVIFSDKPPTGILTGAERKVKQMEPVGVVQADMTDSQKVFLRNLIGNYVDRYKESIASEVWKKIEAAGVENIRFGWAGGIKRGEAFYYRIQGPTFLIEAANSQNNANHMHTVWRDFDGDFGRDFLGEHYKGHDH